NEQVTKVVELVVDELGSMLTQLRHTLVQTVAGGFDKPVGIEHDRTRHRQFNSGVGARNIRLSTQQQVVVLVEETGLPVPQHQQRRQVASVRPPQNPPPFRTV